MISRMEEEVRFLEECLTTNDASLIKDALARAIEAIKIIAEENESVWSLLEEIRASDMSNHRDLVQNELNRKIAETFSLMSKQVVLA